METERAALPDVSARNIGWDAKKLHMARSLAGFSDWYETGWGQGTLARPRLLNARPLGP
ncbi:MAG: hypothetical protein M3P30_11360 [Chloroflexota bacterium]|nr:hypothetical protein [Chloroflexota bacterium]